MMKQLIDPNSIHSAADTWSGFIYQGKVAIYHILKLINEKDNVDGLHLQLDSLEDFAIIRYEDGIPKPITLHQVKAVKSHYYSKYKEAFEKLEQRKTDFPCDEEAYFHLASRNEKSKIDIEVLHPKIKIYTYDCLLFCKIEDIENKIKHKLRLCLSKYGLIHLSNDNYLETLSYEVDSLVIRRILSIHSQNHNPAGESINKLAYKETISLNRFKNIIIADLTSLHQDKSFFLSKIRLDFNRYYQDYCYDYEDDIDLDQQNKLHLYLIFFNGLNDSQFESFLQTIIPNRVVKFSSLNEYKDNSIVKDEIKNAFLSILHIIRKSDNSNLNKLGWIDNESRRYYPSTIIFSNTSKSKEQVSIDILETSLEIAIDVPFNTDYLITEGCNVTSIEEQVNKSTRLDQQQLALLNETDNSIYNNITKWKKISLMELEQAKQKLNENNN